MKPRLKSVVRILGWSAAACGGMSGLVLAADVTLNGTVGNSCMYSSITTDALGDVTVACNTGSGGGTTPTISFSPTSYSVTEGQTASIKVVRSGNTTGTDSVGVSVSGGTASNGIDFTQINPTTVTFAPTETVKNVALTTIDDAVVEGNEMVTFALSSPSSGVSLGSTTASATIVDNDTQIGTCPAFPANRIQAAKWLFNGNPGGTAYYFPDPVGQVATQADQWAQQFTITATAPHIMVSLMTHVNAGGAAGKEVAVSACPGDFNVPNACKRSFGSNQSTNILISSGSPTAYCDLPLGTYFLNIRAIGGAGASTLVSSYKLP